jgi:hypothetical protein
MTSFSSTGSSAPLLVYVITEKLNKTNYSMWKAQVLPILRGAQLQGYLDGTNVTPAKTIEGKPTPGKEEATQRGESRVCSME